MFSSQQHKFIAEFLGTFVLVFTGTGAIVANEVSKGAITHVGIALTFGLVIVTLAYSLGEISGCHLNPAVTLGFFAAKRFEANLIAPYIISQCAGAIAASLSLRLMFPAATTLGATLPSGSSGQSFVMEFILTAILMFVVLCVSTGSKEIGILAGVAVGALIGLEAMFAGPISGASMNPARSLGPALVSMNTGTLWIYILAPILGSFAGVIAHYFVQAPKSETASAK
jgi:aquaporin Z